LQERYKFNVSGTPRVSILTLWAREFVHSFSRMISRMFTRKMPRKPLDGGLDFEVEHVTGSGAVTISEGEYRKLQSDAAESKKLITLLRDSGCDTDALWKGIQGGRRMVWMTKDELRLWSRQHRIYEEPMVWRSLRRSLLISSKLIKHLELRLGCEIEEAVESQNRLEWLQHMVEEQNLDRDSALDHYFDAIDRMNARLQKVVDQAEAGVLPFCAGEMDLRAGAEDSLSLRDIAMGRSVCAYVGNVWKRLENTGQRPTSHSVGQHAWCGFRSDLQEAVPYPDHGTQFMTQCMEYLNNTEFSISQIQLLNNIRQKASNEREARESAPGGSRPPPNSPPSASRPMSQEPWASERIASSSTLPRRKTTEKATSLSAPRNERPAFGSPTPVSPLRLHKARDSLPLSSSSRKGKGKEPQLSSPASHNERSRSPAAPRGPVLRPGPARKAVVVHPSGPRPVSQSAVIEEIPSTPATSKLKRSNAVRGEASRQAVPKRLDKGTIGVKTRSPPTQSKLKRSNAVRGEAARHGLPKPSDERKAAVKGRSSANPPTKSRKKQSPPPSHDKPWWQRLGDRAK
jgi:hypothetical protein